MKNEDFFLELNLTCKWDFSWLISFAQVKVLLGLDLCL
jgi:hypothetical protein